MQEQPRRKCGQAMAFPNPWSFSTHGTSFLHQHIGHCLDVAIDTYIGAHHDSCIFFILVLLLSNFGVSYQASSYCRASRTHDRIFVDGHALSWAYHHDLCSFIMSPSTTYYKKTFLHNL